MLSLLFVLSVSELTKEEKLADLANAVSELRKEVEALSKIVNKKLTLKESQNMYISQNAFGHISPPSSSSGALFRANYNDIRNLNGKVDPDRHNLNLNSNLNRNSNLNQKASPGSSYKGSGLMYQKSNFFSAKNIPIPVLPASSNKK